MHIISPLITSTTLSLEVHGQCLQLLYTQLFLAMYIFICTSANGFVLVFALQTGQDSQIWDPSGISGRSVEEQGPVMGILWGNIKRNGLDGAGGNLERQAYTISRRTGITDYRISRNILPEMPPTQENDARMSTRVRGVPL